MKKLLVLIIVLAMAFATIACANGNGNGAADPPPAANGGNGADEAGDVGEAGEEAGEAGEEAGEAGEEAGEAGEFAGRTITIWSFTDEVERQSTIFRGMFPEINVETAVVNLDDGAYEEWVLTALAAGGDAAPDILYLEAAIVRHFVEGPFLISLDDLLPQAEALETYQFVLDIGMYDGEARAFSWQATPGAMYYRRSMAEEIFGTCDPDTIQNYFRDIDTMLDTARRIQAESGGSMFFSNHYNAFSMPFNANRDNAWIVDNSLYVDPIMLDYMTFARTVREEGLDAQIGNWSPDWFASMADEFTDIDGNPLDLFSYVLPTWGLAHVIYANHEGNAGDWAMMTGPLPYTWGGTWLGVPRASANQDLGRLFIESTVLNDEFLANWALGVYTLEYMRAIDPDVGDAVFQGGGDFVSSARVVREIADQFDGSPIYHFLGGQNPYLIFAAAAPLLDLGLIQGTDSTIQAAFGEAVDLYVEGALSREEALDFFRENVHAAIPWLD